MGDIKVLAGDIEPGAWSLNTFFGSALMEKNVFSKNSPKIDLKEEAESIEILDEEKINKLGRKAGWAFLGGVALGPLGLVGGALLGGRKKKVTFACELKDGRKFMAETDGKSWKKMYKTILTATFS